MSLKSLSDYTIYSKYAHYIPEKKRRETWDEIVDRVFGMHEKKYSDVLENNSDFFDDFYFAKQSVLDKKVLGSQRALQFGGNPILNKNERIYNCVSTVIDRPRAFQEIGFLLLCGCGAGYSVQNHHIDKLPSVISTKPSENITVTYKAEDSVEGWAECWGILINSYLSDGIYPEYEGKNIEFDLSAIRPEGSLVANQFKAPGPVPLFKSFALIENILKSAMGRKLTALECHDIICHIADSVISGGVRRSALISLFSKDDHAMAQCKTGNWLDDNPQRARANNSAVLHRNSTTKEEFDTLFENIKSFGEPGFYFVDDSAVHATTNPCVEIGFSPVLPDGRSGFGACNLTEINGDLCHSREDFLDACKAASFIGTLQAGYNSFPYMGEVTEEIIRKEALLGVSITGWMDNPAILFDETNLKDGVEQVKIQNEKTASAIGINPAARLTCTKPSGNASCVLMTGSGIHANHSKKFLRRVQCNKKENAAKIFKKKNPLAVVESVWSANKSDNIISFPCESPHGAITKGDLTGVDFLEKIKFAFTNWVLPGTIPERGNDPTITHNISCTVNVSPDEWDNVRDYIYNNRHSFSGISLLSGSGDLDYDQAPFVEILTPLELVETYGDAVPLASGLIVDGLRAFNTLWTACSAVFGLGKKLTITEEPVEPKKPVKKRFAKNTDYIAAMSDYGCLLNEYYNNLSEYDKSEWVRRATQFAERYFDGDIKKMTYCLKHVSLWKDWLDIKRTWHEIEWENVKEETQHMVAIDTLSAVACSGGKCELI